MQISAPAEYIILGLLKSQPMHGYEMFQKFENSTLGEIIHLEMNQMYAFIKKLEKLGYIETILETQETRPPRKIHSLTQSGDAVFQEWLTQPVEKPRDIRMLFLIKLYFVQKFMPHTMSTLIDQEISACNHFLQHLEAKHPSDVLKDDDTFFDQIVLRSRIHQTHALLEWMQELQTTLAVTHSL
ncbi:MAG: PadR family transcriptional regulator [Ktedonobacteraceae bacterium]